MVLDTKEFIPSFMTEDGFRRYDKGVDEYKQVRVIQGPTCHGNGVRSYGSMTSGVMFIGISPAEHEVTKSKRPLTGPSGQLLNICLEALGLRRDEAYCTNVVCEWMNQPSLENIQECRLRLNEEIRILKPKLIVYLGAIVSEYFTNRKFGKVRGAVQWSSEFNCYTMATYHPSAILRSMGDYGSSKDDKASVMIYDFVRDIKKLHDVVTWPDGAPQAKVRYRVVTSKEQAQNVLDNLPRNEEYPVALDVETTYDKDDEEVEVFKDTLLCVGVGTDNYCWVFTPEALYNEDDTPALTWPNLWWTMHNSIFDTQVMRRRLGIWINVREDTMLQSYSLDERSGIHRLKTLAREYLGAGFYEDDRFYGKMALSRIPKRMLYEYNAKDVCYTARLCAKFRKWQIEENVRDFYNRLLIPAVNVYKEAQYHGVNIDMKVHEAFTYVWGHKLLEEEDELLQIARDEGWEGPLKLSSPKQLAEFLFKILSLPITKYTKGGEPSVDREVLEKLADQHEFISKLQAHRRRWKMWSQYIIGLPEALREDGRAHPVVKLHGQVNGRPSFTGLAVQTFVAPSAPHEYNNMRRFVIPPPFTGYEGEDGYVCPEDDEYVIVEVDFGKAELWVAQSVSNDQQMFQDLLSGDYHTNVAMDIYEKQRQDVTGDDRTWAKRTSFGILYDIEKNTLAKLTKSNPYDAQERINRWNKRNSGYHQWALNTQRQITQTGELQLASGRKRRIIILGNSHRAAKQAVNAPIQATSSDIVLDSVIEIAPRIKRIGGHVLFTVHDSIVTKALRSRLEEHCWIMHDIMTKVHFKGIKPIPVEIKVGSSWYDVKGVHDCAEPVDHKVNNNPTYNIHMREQCTWLNQIKTYVS